MMTLEEIQEKIKTNIIDTYKNSKKELFYSNGKIFSRDWNDLTPKYKKYKEKKLGSAYPINIFSGKLLEELLNNALAVEVFFNEDSDKMDFKINIDSKRMNVEYADDVNKLREYISFSTEEKSLINNIVQSTIKESLGVE